MPRYRKISPINIEEKKKIAKEKNFVINDISMEGNSVNKNYQGGKEKKIFHPKTLKQSNPKKPRQTRSPQEVVCSTCSNLRGVCRNIRTFADDMDNLLDSVENLVPIVETLVAGYARSFKNILEKPKDSTKLEGSNKIVKTTENKATTSNTNSTENLTSNNATTTDTSNTSASNSKTTNEINTNLTRNSNSNSIPKNKIPSEQDLKDFLNNPLVISLVKMLTKQLKQQ